MSKTNGTLRIASLIRVSTEKQERQGESLRTQEAQLTAAVASLGGTIVKRYAGQEHATAGSERKQVEQLLADSARKPHRPFDAVIVADPTRWSRDNVQSETGLEHLRKCGVRFFVLTTEYDLYEPQARLFLSLSATIGAFHAGVQKQKSIINRINRAKRGLPTCGKLPYGRVWDKKAERWTVDPEKQKIIADVAHRYLAGEALPKLAREYGIDHSSLHKILTQRCGDKWEISFRADDLKINETVQLTIPPLLPEKTIRAILHKAKANRTYQHGTPKHAYLLGGFIFCGECGYNMLGHQMGHGERRYYRHTPRERTRACSIDPRPLVRADLVEGKVIKALLDLFGNRAAMDRAFERAIPNRAKVIETEKKIKRLETEISNVSKARNSILGLVARDAITEEQAGDNLIELKERETTLLAELDRARMSIEHVPNLDDGKALFEFLNEFAKVHNLATVSHKDQSHLIKSVFGSPLPDGRPAGVYLYPAGKTPRHRPKNWKFSLMGSFEGPIDLTTPVTYGEIFELVTPSASR
jgi:site-specific DNA recombinase